MLLEFQSLHLEEVGYCVGPALNVTLGDPEAHPVRGIRKHVFLDIQNLSS